MVSQARLDYNVSRCLALLVAPPSCHWRNPKLEAFFALTVQDDALCITYLVEAVASRTGCVGRTLIRSPPHRATSNHDSSSVVVARRPGLFKLLIRSCSTSSPLALRFLGRCGGLRPCSQDRMRAPTRHTSMEHRMGSRCHERVILHSPLAAMLVLNPRWLPYLFLMYGVQVSRHTYR